MFATIDYLESRGIEYRESGKNVWREDVNICCPFCGDSKYHLGIHKDTGHIKCWSCNFEGISPRPKIIDLIMELDRVDRSQAYFIFKDFAYEGIDEKKKVQEKPKQVTLPPECESFTNPKSPYHFRMALKYLESRNFNYKHIHRYQLQFCSVGRYAYRIIIPVYFKGQLVTFLARDFSGKSQLRYDNCPKEDSILSPTEVLYGWDYFCGSHCRLVEGSTDVWRLGASSLATLTNKMSTVQKALLISLNLASISLIYDLGSYEIGLGIAEDLSPFVGQIRVVRMDSQKDVADRSFFEIVELEKKTKFFRA